MLRKSALFASIILVSKEYNIPYMQYKRLSGPVAEWGQPAAATNGHLCHYDSDYITPYAILVLPQTHKFAGGKISGFGITCDHTLLPCIYRRGEGGNDTFTCRIICSKTRFCFFLWLVEKQYLWFAVFWLVVTFQWDFRPEAGQKTKWCRRISVKILWRQSVVQVKMFWPFSQRVSWKPQRCWNVSELLTKWKRRLLGNPRSCSRYYPY